ncbi:hypothetical protein NGM10_02320 [Halorussus salilacus]|uniref:hypothetical protein n=1 Tax=Halorussus salilacus TaxID=2953750 RepID=UPI0020A1E783|nr:hypothetical protein [Halorussus salilacus]USZ68587.1 hypothetical protein NGM10_02320 [Halorussus salilacus]
MADQLQPNDLEEGTRVELEWSPKGSPGTGKRAEGEVTRVWRPDGDVEQFTVQTDDFALNVYTDYRDPPVERVEGDEDPDAETVGRLDGITRTGT